VLNSVSQMRPAVCMQLECKHAALLVAVASCDCSYRETAAAAGAGTPAQTPGSAATGALPCSSRQAVDLQRYSGMARVRAADSGLAPQAYLAPWRTCSASTRWAGASPATSTPSRSSSRRTTTRSPSPSRRAHMFTPNPRVGHVKYCKHACHGRSLLASVGACEPTCRPCMDDV